MIYGEVGVDETPRDGRFPLKKRYSPFIFQKEMLDKRFTKGVNTKLTKKRDRSRFCRGQFGGSVVNVTGSSIDGSGRGCWGGKGFSLLPFPNSI
jgi:hypothetical protein